MKLPKVYEPDKYEEDIYALWEKAKAFVPKHRGSDASYSIVVPPPNANGDLHIGHALTFALEDIAARYHRMKGEATLLLPGADHAGFETQVVYEKQLAKQGKSRFDFSREELYKQIWDFVAENRENYESQFRRLGFSVDWSHYTFTLDPKIIATAYKTFKKMWEEGLIYRGERLVNFCTFHGTAFADIEVAYSQEPGHLWYIDYPLTDGSGVITVATTRPETMLGDTAVAVHPDDKRFQRFVGKTVKVPLTEREIPVLADTFVDKNFGTGAVKITPAHDPNDFEVAERHDLPKISVIDHEGKMTIEAGEAYRGLKVNDARAKVVEDLKRQDSIQKIEDITHSVGHCYKCNTVIQPLLREQWFVDMQPLAIPAIQALEAGKIKFYPESKRDQLIVYLKGLKDWNISRQIAWGIPIPAFVNVDNPDDWIYDDRVGEEEIRVGTKTFRRDPDVFDTWFSSSSWPYATLDYPNSADFKEFYPLSLMETGGEILYPWVSRMIMLGLYVTGKIPFEAVYVHGYVLAEDGAKMSKSIGNVINPLEAINEYGSDALRMGIISGRAPAINRGYDRTKVEGGRNFSNKLWNIARYIEDKVGDQYSLKDTPKPTSTADHWILTKLQHLTEVVSRDLARYRFSEAYDELYHTVWDDFADWYIEASKATPNLGLLAYSLEVILKVAHPFAPFVTETIWQKLSWKPSSLLVISPWPTVKAGQKDQVKIFETIKSVVSEVRYLSTELHQSKTNLYYANAPFVADNAILIQQLAHLGSVQTGREGKGLQLKTTPHAWLDIDSESLKRYAAQLQERLNEQAVLLKHLKQRLANKNYVKQAPKAVVEQTKSQLAASTERLRQLQDDQKRFSAP